MRHIHAFDLWFAAVVGAMVAAQSATPVYAQSVMTKRGQVLLDPAGRQMIIVKDGDRKTHDLTHKEEIEIAPREIVKVGIANQMPLIFTYKLDGIVLSDTPDFQAVSAFAKSIPDLLKIPKALPAAALVAGAPAKCAIDSPPTVPATSDARRALYAKGFNDDFVNCVIGLRNRLKADVGEMRDLTIETLKGPDQLKHAQGRVAGTAEQPENCRTTNTCPWNTEWKQALVDEYFKIVALARNEMFAQMGTAGFIASDPAFIEALSIVAGEEANVRAWLKTATEFSALVRVTGSDLPFKDEINYDPIHNATASVTVAFVKGARDLANDYLPAEGIDGTYVLAFEPANPIAFGAGLAAVFVFVRDPNKDPQTADYIGFRPAAFLTVAPRSWVPYLGTPHIEIGFTPETDRIGIYFGAGIRIRSAFTLTGGVTAQQFKVNGQSTFTPAAYFGASLELQPK